MKTEDNVQLEVYRTPPWVYELLYAKYPKHFIGVGLDPSAGDGRMLAALNNKSGVLCDIRKSERRAWKKHPRLRRFLHFSGDFLALSQKNLPKSVNFVVTNPPFSLAQPIIDKCFQIVKPNGWIWILQRCDFLAGQKRSNWHKQHGKLRRVLIITKRPTWELDNKPVNSADTRDYAWFGYCNNDKHKKATVDWLFIDKETKVP